MTFALPQTSLNALLPRSETPSPKDQHPADVHNHKNDSCHTHTCQQNNPAVLSGFMRKSNPVLRCWILLIRIHGLGVVSSIDKNGKKRSYKCSQCESDTQSNKYATNVFHLVPSR